VRYKAQSIVKNCQRFKKKILPPKRQQLFNNGQGGMAHKTPIFTSSSVLPSNLAEAIIQKYKLAHA
jgi:hypothetical protein